MCLYSFRLRRATLGAIAVTNPPYARIDAFIARTIALLDSGHLSAAVLLVRPDFVGTDGRAAYEWTCCWRPVWIPGTKTQPRWRCEWFAWLAGCSGPPMNRRANLTPRKHEGLAQPEHYVL